LQEKAGSPVKNLQKKMIMKPSSIDNSNMDLFRNRLSNQLKMKHELIVLSQKIDWKSLEAELGNLYEDSSRGGQPPKPVRLIVGIMLLQHMHQLSDELVVARWVENPYWQYFCGYDYLQWECPIDPSSLTRWRKRLSTEMLEKILSMTVSVALDVGMVKEKDLKKVIADTTVMPKHIEYPTDTKLLEKARRKLVKLAKEHGIDLRQNYNLVSKKSLRKLGGYLHAKQMKRAKKEAKHFRVLVGRVLRDCERHIAGNAQAEEAFAVIIHQTRHLLTRQKHDKKKLYSLHEPHVDCISKGKAHKRYEFGCKVALSMTHRKNTGLITSALALHDNPFDGHTLKSTLEASARITGVKVEQSFVDKGYRGHDVTDSEVFISGMHKGITSAIRKQLKRRQAIEPHIGHLKNEGRLGLCRLKGIAGDHINTIISAAAYNLKRILTYLRKVFVYILQCIFMKCGVNALSYS
jgi:transposase, IS5 family